METTTSWTVKLDEPRESELRPVEAGRRNLRAGDIMLYPNGRAVDDMIRTIPAGQARTQRELRVALAERFDADITCPVTTRRSLHTVLEAANEAAQNGTPMDQVTPVWRVADLSPHMLKRLSFDPDFLLDQRAREDRSA
jgi:hypothetical protein